MDGYFVLYCRMDLDGIIVVVNEPTESDNTISLDVT